jgi:hypothetical protein
MEQKMFPRIDMKKIINNLKKYWKFNTFFLLLFFLFVLTIIFLLPWKGILLKIGTAVSSIFSGFENIYRFKIAYISAFIVIFGSLLFILKRFYFRFNLNNQMPGILDSYRKLKNKKKKFMPYICMLLAIFCIYLFTRLPFSYAFVLAAGIITCVFLYLINHPKKLFIVAVLIILLFLAPHVFKGQDTHVKIFDVLEAWIPQTKVLAESGKAFSLNPETKIENIANGLRLSGVNSGFNGLTWLFMIFDPFVAYVLNIFIMTFVAFFGMVLLLKHFVIKDKEYLWVVIGTSLCFSLLPFFPPGGLLIPGLPLLIYCLLKIRNGEKKIRYFAFILLFPFYSLLQLGGVFITSIIGVVFLVDWIRKKEFNTLFFLGVVLLAGGYFLAYFHMIYSFIDPNFISHREEIRIFPLKASICWKQTIENFIFDKTHLYMAQQVFVILAAALAVISGIIKKVKRMNALILLIILTFLNSVLWGFRYWEGIAPLRDKYQLLNSFDFARIYWFNPSLWYIIFALSLVIILKMKHGKALVSIFLISQLLFLFTNYNWEYRHLLGRKNRLTCSLTYKEFYSEALFKDIHQFINKPKKDYRIVCLGMHPGVANYNGFYTLDVFSNIYPLEYKHKFRRIIEKELEKNKDVKRLFDENGKRCYILSAELHKKGMRGLTFSRGITKKQGHLKVKNLELNTAALKEMGGEYIFSAVEIMNYAENNLSFEKAFLNKDSPWKIYLYKVI